jgi:hypothetical protein
MVRCVAAEASPRRDARGPFPLELAIVAFSMRAVELRLEA